MNGKAARFCRFAVGLAGLVTLGWVLTGQASRPAHHGIPLPFDWSHRHLIFSQPKTPEQAQRVAQDLRYWQQLHRSDAHLMRSASQPTGASNPFEQGRQSGVHRDWAENMGSSAATGAGNYPAKFSFDSTTANCGGAAHPDFVVFGTGVAGSPTQASIIAYDNLYSGCGGTVPSTFWAYNTGGTILTSPVLSRDGSQIAFVQTAGGAGTLVLLKWASSGSETAGAPGTPTSVVPASYPSCAVPCMTTIALTSGSNAPTDDTTSSVFYYYVGDTAWVSDSAGWLHQFTGVFLGTPAEVRTAPWPVQVNPGTPTAATSPVFERFSGNVLMADAGGFVYRVDSATGLVTTSAQLDFGTGFVEGPIVDSGAGTAYVFASSDGLTNCNGNPCSAVYQLSTTFPPGDVGTEAAVGTSDPLTPNPMYDGGFDNAYLSSVNATGNLYACGNTGANPILYQIPIQAGVLGTAVSVTALAPTINIPVCSPVTDVYNPSPSGPGGGPAEWIYVSVQHHSLATSCASKGCIMNFLDTPWHPSTAYLVGQEILSSRLYIEVVTTAGTSGLVPPRWSTSAGGTNIDGSVHWLTQGVLTASTPASWLPNHSYARAGIRIVDSNSNIQVVQVLGTSGAASPVWSMTPGATTIDNTVRWINAGVVATNGLVSTGGTSGIIIDNFVNPAGPPAGTSQVYFSTLGILTCGTTGAGGCAMQASQPALK